MRAPINTTEISENYNPLIRYKSINPQHPIENLYLRIDFGLKFIDISYCQAEIELEVWRIETEINSLENLSLLISMIEKGTSIDTCDLNMGRDMQKIILSWATTSGNDAKLIESSATRKE